MEYFDVWGMAEDKVPKLRPQFEQKLGKPKPNQTGLFCVVFVTFVYRSSVLLWGQTGRAEVLRSLNETLLDYKAKDIIITTPSIARKTQA